MCNSKRKKLPNFLFFGKIASFQKYAFSSTSWVQKNALIISTVIVRIAFEPLQIINGGLSHSIMREKIGQSLLPRENSLFLKNLVLDFLGPKEMIISLAQYLSENHVYSYKLFPEVFFVVCHVKYYEKKQVKVFFTWKIASFQKFAFSSTSWVQQNALISSTVIVRIAFEPLRIINGGLSHSIMREKIGQNLLPREDSFFWNIWFSTS